MKRWRLNRGGKTCFQKPPIWADWELANLGRGQGDSSRWKFRKKRGGITRKKKMQELGSDEEGNTA